MPEVTYLTQILELYARNVRYPDKTKFPYFFGQKEQATNLYAKLAGSMVEKITSSLPADAEVVFKDPWLSLFLLPAQEVLGDRYRYLGIVRHPAEALASMKRVVERSGNGWDLKAQTTSIYLYYDSIRLFQKETQVQNLVVRYEDLIDRDPKTVSAIENHIEAKLVWNVADADWLKIATPFSSRGYGKRFDRSFAGIGAETLDVDELDYVQDVLSGVMQHWQYERKFRP